MKPFVKTLLIGTGIIVTGIGGYKLYQHITKKQSDPESEDGVSGGGVSSSNTWSTNTQNPIVPNNISPTTKCETEARFPLRSGDSGVQVKKLQEFLNKFGDRNISENCVYDAATKSAVDAFFKKYYGESVEGEVTYSVFKYIINPSLRDGKLLDLNNFWNQPTKLLINW